MEGNKEKVRKRRTGEERARKKGRAEGKGGSEKSGIAEKGKNLCYSYKRMTTSRKTR